MASTGVLHAAVRAPDAEHVFRGGYCCRGHRWRLLASHEAPVMLNAQPYRGQGVPSGPASCWTPSWCRPTRRNASNPSGAGMLARTVVGNERRSLRKKWRSSTSMPTGGNGTRRATAASAARTD
jgi:hypothetical protein